MPRSPRTGSGRNCSATSAPPTRFSPRSRARGIAHWHVTYQVASEELFRIWAASAGTNLIARKPGDPLPRLALDGIAVVEWNEAGLCEHFRLWWHSVVAT